MLDSLKLLTCHILHFLPLQSSTALPTSILITATYLDASVTMDGITLGEKLKACIGICRAIVLALQFQEPSEDALTGTKNSKTS